MINYIEDGTYWTSRRIEGYQCPFLFAMGPREPGKTAHMWYKKIYLGWKIDKRPWVYMTRTAVEITEALIESIFDVNIRKFTNDKIEVKYNKGTFKEGIVDVFVNGDIFVRLISLSLPLRRIKLAVLKNIKGVYTDEYIIDPKSQESYVKNEGFKIKEAYTTWRREVEGVLKFYFTANPYSLFNPLFVELGVDTSKLRKGEVYTNGLIAVEWVTLSDKLRAKLLELNPFYKFDEDYSNYALEGTAINDKDINLSEKPLNYSLAFVFRLNDKFIGVYRNNYMIDFENYYYCEFLKEIGSKRTAYCFDFNDLIKGCALLCQEDRIRLSHFKGAMRNRRVAFKDINVYYFIEELYKNL